MILLIGTGDGSRRRRWKKMAAAVGAGLGFVLLTAPLWLTFITTLAKSWTIYDTPRAWQIDPRALAGLFDDLFYRQPWVGELTWNPALNFCLLTGVLWALADAKRLTSGRQFLAVAVAVAGCLLLAFRVIPEAWIVRWPFVGRIVHVDNTFSSVALGLLAVLAGAGWAQMISEPVARRWWRCYAMSVVLMLGLLGVYFSAARGVEFSPFFKGYAPLLFAAALVWPLLVRRWVIEPELRPGTLVWVMAVWLLLHARHGQQLNGFIDAEVVNPQMRVDLKAPSRAVEFVRAEHAEPSRVVGFGYRLYQGYNQALLLETPFGIDPLHTVDYTNLAREFGITRVVGVDAPTPEATFERDKRFYDLLNVRHFLAETVDAPRAGIELRSKGKFDLGVFESAEAWPRAFFSDTVERTVGLAGFAARVRTGNGRPFVALEALDWAELGAAGAALGQGTTETRGIVRASGYKLTTNTTAFDIVATGRGIVALQEAYVPGDFRAEVNGKPTAVLRVNHAFKGVLIPEAGRYRVVFSYWPEFFSLALWFGAVGAAGLLAGGFVAIRFRSTACD
jgi:hypothetical protein